MKKLLCIMLLTCLVTACAVTRQMDSMVGVYRWKPSDQPQVSITKATLTLRQNGAFDLEWLGFNNGGYKQSYTGKWATISDNRIWLDFDEFANLADYLGWHAISYEDREVEIISKNEIETDSLIFKRIKRCH